MLSVNMTPLANWTLMCSLEKQAVRYLFPSVVLMVSCIFFFCLSVPDVMLIKIIIITEHFCYLLVTNAMKAFDVR